MKTLLILLVAALVIYPQLPSTKYAADPDYEDYEYEDLGTE